MRRFAFFGKSGTLGNAETMLFVGDNESKRAIFYVFLNYSVSSDDNIYFSRFETSSDISALFWSYRTRQQADFYTKGFEKLHKSFKMLCGENFGRRHDSRLKTVFYSKTACRRCNGSFSASDVALQKAVHGKISAHIGKNFIDGGRLTISQLKGKSAEKIAHIGIFIHSKRSFFAASKFQHKHSQLQFQKFFKSDPFACSFGCGIAFGEVDIFQ